MRYALMFLFFLSACSSTIKYPDGGYKYSADITEKDSNEYFYPFKNIVPKKDSFQNALAYKYFQAFNEPNLSLRPLDNETFRFVYDGWKAYPTIIILSDKKIVVKRGNRTYINENDEDETRLTEEEKPRLRLLKRYFPLDTAGKKPGMKRYMDSIIKSFPSLLDSKYYRYLVDKATSPGNDPFTYITKTIDLTEKQYLDLVNTINASGYWQLPYRVDCKNDMTDGYGFILEANTKEKYNKVSAVGCPDDTTKFTKACQMLVDAAQLNKEIILVWKGTTQTVE